MPTISDLRTALGHALLLSHTLLSILRAVIEADCPLTDTEVAYDDHQRPNWRRTEVPDLTPDHQLIWSHMSDEDQQTFADWQTQRYRAYNARTYDAYTEALSEWRTRYTEQRLAERQQNLIGRIGEGCFHNLVALVPTTFIIGNKQFVLDTIFGAPDGMTGWDLFQYTVNTIQTRLQERMSPGDYICALEEERQRSETEVILRVGTASFSTLVELAAARHDQPRTTVLSIIHASDLEDDDLQAHVTVVLTA
jgi:hypothetical protein